MKMFNANRKILEERMKKQRSFEWTLKSVRFMYAYTGMQSVTDNDLRSNGSTVAYTSNLLRISSLPGNDGNLRRKTYWNCS